MSNVLAFTPRPRPVTPPPISPIAGSDLRFHLEEAAQTALDAADKIIAALDRIDEGAAIESRPAPVAITAEPIRLPKPIEVQAEPEITSTPILEPIILPEPIEPAPSLRWYGAGNIISAAGIALLSLMVRA